MLSYVFHGNANKISCLGLRATKIWSNSSQPLERSTALRFNTSPTGVHAVPVLSSSTLLRMPKLLYVSYLYHSLPLAYLLFPSQVYWLPVRRAPPRSNLHQVHEPKQRRCYGRSRRTWRDDARPDYVTTRNFTYRIVRFCESRLSISGPKVCFLT